MDFGTYLEYDCLNYGLITSIRFENGEGLIIKSRIAMSDEFSEYGPMQFDTVSGCNFIIIA